MSLQHIQKNSPRLLPKPAKFEKNPPNSYRVIRKTKCGAGGAGSSPIHKQASLVGRFKKKQKTTVFYQILCFGEILCYTHLSQEIHVCMKMFLLIDDYSALRTSVIGALKANLGIDVQKLSMFHVKEDLRQSLHCWISKQLPATVPYG